MKGAVLEARGLSLDIGGKALFHSLDLRLAPGQCWAVLGTNGVGKSMLLRTLAGLGPPALGELMLDGSPLQGLSRRKLAQRLGLLLQDSHDAFPLTVLETVLMGRHPHLALWAHEGERDHELARAALAAMELGGTERRQVQTLSGGERRRLAAATLLTQDPAIVLADEPANHLDLRHQTALLAKFRALAREGRSVMMVLHDPTQAARYCDRVLFLFGGGKWASGPADRMLTAENLSRLYGHSVVAVESAVGPVFVPA